MKPIPCFAAGENDFGYEAVDTLLKLWRITAMTDSHCGRLSG